MLDHRNATWFSFNVELNRDSGVIAYKGGTSNWASMSSPAWWTVKRDHVAGQSSGGVSGGIADVARGARPAFNVKME